MFMDSRPVSALCEYLAAQPRVWVRVGAIRIEDDWQLALLEVTAGEPPPSWRRQRWGYERAVFVASAPAGASVAKWLAHGRISLPSLSIKLQLEGSASVERRDSNFEGIYERLPWPTREWNVHLQNTSGQTLNDEMVASDMPAFITFDWAAAEFFGVAFVHNRNFSGREVVVRQQDRRARIDHVLVRPTELLVRVGGDHLAGTSLALSGADGQRRSLSRRTRQVRLPTPAGLGPGAWIALHRDQELLDRRILDRSWGGRDFDVEVDAATRVEVLISGGERAIVEFKRELPDSDPRQAMKTVAAFANGRGGTLLFGVDDEGQVVGLGKAHTRQNVDRLTSLISDWVRPLPSFEVEMVDIDGRGVIAINVDTGSEPPYGIGTSERDVRFYVRRVGNSFPASPADVRAIVQPRVAATQALHFPPARG